MRHLVIVGGKSDLRRAALMILAPPPLAAALPTKPVIDAIERRLGPRRPILMAVHPGMHAPGDAGIIASILVVAVMPAHPMPRAQLLVIVDGADPLHDGDRIEIDGHRAMFHIGR